jgi:hypothetical protein
MHAEKGCWVRGLRRLWQVNQGSRARAVAPRDVARQLEGRAEGAGQLCVPRQRPPQRGTEGRQSVRHPIQKHRARAIGPESRASNRVYSHLYPGRLSSRLDTSDRASASSTFSTTIADGD